MNRRQYLAASGLVAISTSGCTGVIHDAHLTADDVIEHGSSVVVPFRDDEDDIMQFQLQKQFTEDEKRDYYPFTISTLQPNGNLVESLRLQFRSPPHTSGFSPAGISLRENAHAHKSTLSQDESNPSITILDLPDTVDIGRGSVKVNLLLAGDQEYDPQELWISVDAELSSDRLLGPDYSATGDFIIQFP